jgi:holo-[acyl-carrier protein] synthase
VILGLGIEVVDVRRFERALARHGERLSARLFTPGERQAVARSARPAQGLAARFAAKVAARRALGLAAVRFLDVEVVRGPGGEPSLQLSGAAGLRARELGVRGSSVSLSHERGACLGHVLLEGEGRARA